MLIHTPSSVGTDSSHTETMRPRMGMIANSLSPVIQSEILGILQREQDCAMALLSSSPLLASLFVSYANQAVAFESASATPSPESEERKVLQNTIVTLQDGISKLKSENLGMAKGLEVARASQEALHSQVSSLKDVNTSQENDIESLRAELFETKERYDRLTVDSDAENATLRSLVSDLEAQWEELKEIVVEQQIKMSKLEPQGFASLPNISAVVTPTEATHTPQPEIPRCMGAVESELSISAVDREKAEKQCEKEREEKEAQERKERVEREEREVQEKKELEERKERERQEKAEQDARKRNELEEGERKEEEELAERERIEKEAREQAEREVREQTERRAKERAERDARFVRRRAEKEAKERAETEKLKKAAKRRSQNKAAKRANQEAREEAEREEKERAEAAARVRVAKRRAKKEAKEQAKREAREKAKQEAREKAEREAKEKVERDEERVEKERAENDAKEKTDRNADEREEALEEKVSTSNAPSARDSTAGKSDHSRKTSGLPQKEEKSECASIRDFTSAERKEESSDLPPIVTSPVPGGMPNGAHNLGGSLPTWKLDSLGGEGVEARTPLTEAEDGKKSVDVLSNLSKIATPMELTNLGKPDIPKDMNLSVNVSVSSENKRPTNAEQGPSPIERTSPILAPETAPGALSSATSKLPKTPKDVKEVVPTTPKPWPASTKTERPLSMQILLAPASSLPDGCDVIDSSGVWGGAGGRGNTKPITMSTPVQQDRRSVFADTTRDQKRKNQQKYVAEGPPGSNPFRRAQITAKPASKPTLDPQKHSSWGSWGASLLSNLTDIVTAERSPSPEPPPVKPKIEKPPRGYILDH